MALKNKITILSLLAALFLSPPLVAAGKDETQSVDVEPFLPVWALEQHELTVVSVAPLVVGDKTVGAVTVYDDATKGLSIIGSFTTVKATSWRLAGLIDLGLKGRLSTAVFWTEQTNPKESSLSL